MFNERELKELSKRASEFSSYEIELRNRVTQNEKLHFELLTQSQKMKSYIWSY